MTGGERNRQTEKETNRQRKTGRERDREMTGSERNRQTEKETSRQRKTDRERDRDGHRKNDARSGQYQRDQRATAGDV